MQVAGLPLPRGGQVRFCTTVARLLRTLLTAEVIEPERSRMTYMSSASRRLEKSRSSSVGLCGAWYGSMNTKSPLACGLSVASLGLVPAASSMRSLTPSLSVSPLLASVSLPSRTPLQLASSALSARPSSSLSRSLKSGRVSPSVSRGGLPPASS